MNELYVDLDKVQERFQGSLAGKLVLVAGSGALRLAPTNTPCVISWEPAQANFEERAAHCQQMFQRVQQTREVGVIFSAQPLADCSLLTVQYSHLVFELYGDRLKTVKDASGAFPEFWPLVIETPDLLRPLPGLPTHILYPPES